MIIRLLVNAAALWVAAWLVPGINLAEDVSDTPTRVVNVLVVAVVFALLNTVIKPIIKLLTLPVTLLTLGLFIFIVNAFMLQLTEWVSSPLQVNFSIASFFWDAVLGALIISVVSWTLDLLLPDND